MSNVFNTFFDNYRTFFATLCNARLGGKYKVVSVNAHSRAILRLEQIGLSRGATVTPFMRQNGITIFYLYRGKISLRNRDAQNIRLEPLDDK